MKWSIIALIALGLLAGLCAALLVISLQAPRQEPVHGPDAASEASVSIKILVAAAELVPRDLVVASSVKFREVVRDAAPAGVFTDPVQIIGKVLLVPMTEDQPFTSACFAGDNDRLRLASALAPGTRAVCVTLEDSSGIERILYPGSMVDVLTTMRTMVDEGDEQTLSFTLLQKVMVLAVGPQTIVTQSGAEAPKDLQGSDANVTLLVDTEQAEKLRLAMVTGKVSLVMRNPMDSADGKASGMRLGALAPMLATIENRDRKRREQREKDAVAKVEADRQRLADEIERQRIEIEKARNENKLARERYEMELEKLLAQKQVVPVPTWETQILRGGVSESKTFAIAGGGK